MTTGRESHSHCHAVIGGDGIKGVLKVPMNEEEKAAMDNSAKILKDFWAQVKE